MKGLLGTCAVLLLAACGSSSSGASPTTDGGAESGGDARTHVDAPSETKDAKSDGKEAGPGHTDAKTGEDSSTGPDGKAPDAKADAKADAKPDAAPPRYVIGLGEYYCMAYDTVAHKAIDATTGKAIPGAPADTVAAVGGAHDFALLDSSGNVWMAGGNQFGECGVGSTAAVDTPTQIMTDNTGAAFTNVAQIYQSGAALGWSSIAIKTDGTLWGWGDMSGGNTGDGTMGGQVTRPTQIPFPAGTVITQAAPGVMMIALDSTGTVWDWGASGAAIFLVQNTMTPNYEHPTALSLPGKAIQIAGGSLMNYALLEDGSLYGWAYDPRYVCMGSAQPGIVPVLLNSYLNLPAKITQVATNSQSTYVILEDGTLWAWGDDAVGEIGIGTEIDWMAHNPPYAWDMGRGEMQQAVPVQVAPGKNDFTAIFAGSPAYVFYVYVEDSNNKLYSWGRNKSSVLGDGVEDADPVNGNIAATYPNSWDRSWITEVDPFTLTTLTQATSPYCITNPTANFCDLYTVPVTAPPTCNAGPDQNVTGTTTTLAGTAAGQGGSVVTYNIWTQTAGPSTAVITINSGLTPTVSNLVAGTYTFLLTATDNNWRVSTDSVNVVVQ